MCSEELLINNICNLIYANVAYEVSAGIADRFGLAKHCSYFADEACDEHAEISIVIGGYIGGDHQIATVSAFRSASTSVQFTLHYPNDQTRSMFEGLCNARFAICNAEQSMPGSSLQNGSSGISGTVSEQNHDDCILFLAGVEEIDSTGAMDVIGRSVDWSVRSGDT